ncbi:hypothetical protein CLV36_11674 [Laceyella sediminis]|uniref:Uncharacterized protein n=1 Tax=Laceyella sediminis TaxID=573074 RepID=A0ABX5EK71_9BACL|nr:hypothetical protein [Laceyella sediminis]PRZ12193.1 hypothetical protein CLV36_11674 [Laceyella sediminis]
MTKKATACLPFIHSQVGSTSYKKEHKSVITAFLCRRQSGDKVCLIYEPTAPKRLSHRITCPSAFKIFFSIPTHQPNLSDTPEGNANNAAISFIQLLINLI